MFVKTHLIFRAAIFRAVCLNRATPFSVFAMGRALWRARLVCAAVLLSGSGANAQYGPSFACIPGSSQESAIGFTSGSTCSTRVSILSSVIAACGSSDGGGGAAVATSCVPLPGQNFSVLLAGCSQSNGTLLGLRNMLEEHTILLSETDRIRCDVSSDR